MPPAAVTSAPRFVAPCKLFAPAFSWWNRLFPGLHYTCAMLHACTAADAEMSQELRAAIRGLYLEAPTPPLHTSRLVTRTRSAPIVRGCDAKGTAQAAGSRASADTTGADRVIGTGADRRLTKVRRVRSTVVETKRAQKYVVEGTAAAFAARLAAMGGKGAFCRSYSTCGWAAHPEAMQNAVLRIGRLQDVVDYAFR